MKFVLYSRPGCVLCEEMVQDCAAFPALQGLPLDVINVDSDPQARLRYGHKIPVLLVNGEVVCRGRFDPDEVHKALAYHRRPV